MKYNTLSKEEKRDLKKKFKNTEEGKVILARLNRLFIYGILGILFSIYLFISESSITYILVGSVLLIVSLIYFISSFVLRKKELNNFLIK